VRAIRGRADARKMPSRHTFALARLVSLFRIRASRPEAAEVAIVVDRHQSAAENFAVGGWVLITLAAFNTAVLSKWIPIPAALLVSIPLALLMLQVPIVIIGLVFLRRPNNLRLNSIVLMTLMTLAATHFARAQSWVRFVAWQFLAVLALNAIAAVIVLLLRGTIAEAESSLGGLSSEL
jgi:hypothetical protein